MCTDVGDRLIHRTEALFNTPGQLRDHLLGELLRALLRRCAGACQLVTHGIRHLFELRSQYASKRTVEAACHSSGEILREHLQVLSALSRILLDVLQQQFRGCRFNANLLEQRRRRRARVGTVDLFNQFFVSLGQAVFL